ncbi:class I SAM-dependent methyltransferase [Bradyrhizobium sp. CIAT3101]|uniref:class I SAM-dependent methyltransferase n=1 Tax=Bradyrhizobium sp. CIAT3101 TaxID=439387 RepID=UPI0024B14956|nr:class I SAM-dependent methyltransferase [Bradyrhizobium sp. CIAT3101]WFU83845.1 class I SAM-dependent methyltransferase [Bradyrhizobium sp. CIAT3101]
MHREGQGVSMNGEPRSSRTVADFSSQWTTFPDNSGYFVSIDLFEDSLAGLLSLNDFSDKRVLDLGSGTGRIVRWILKSGAQHVYAVEPAETIEILKENTRERSERITYKNCTGDKIDIDSDVDIAISLGVVSYIENPLPTFRAIRNALRPGGRFYVLLMSREGNAFYYYFVLPLRWMTTKLPDSWLVGVSKFFAGCASIYGSLCRVAPLPMHVYFRSVFMKVAWHERVMLVFDQLNPTYAHYYRGPELRQLFKAAGFTDIKMVHRHGYSWAAIGTRPS